MVERLESWVRREFEDDEWDIWSLVGFGGFGFCTGELALRLYSWFVEKDFQKKKKKGVHCITYFIDFFVGCFFDVAGEG